MDDSIALSSLSTKENIYNASFVHVPNDANYFISDGTSIQKICLAFAYVIMCN